MISYIYSLYSFIILLISVFIIKIFIGLLYVNNFQSDNIVKRVWYISLNTIQEQLELIKLSKFNSSSIAESFLSIIMIFISMVSIFIGYIENINFIEGGFWLYLIILFIGIFGHTFFVLLKNSTYNQDEILKNRLQTILLIFILMSSQYFFQISTVTNIVFAVLSVFLCSSFLFNTFNLEEIESRELFKAEINLFWTIGSINLVVNYFFKSANIFILDRPMLIEPILSIMIIIYNLLLYRHKSNLRTAYAMKINRLMTFVILFTVIRMLFWIF